MAKPASLLTSPPLPSILNANLNSSNSSTWSAYQLSDMQKSILLGISPQGIQCYLIGWSHLLKNPIKGLYCDVAWDEINCWPATRAGETVSRLYSEVMKDDPEIPNAAEIQGSAFRICRDNGTWEWDGWTNYNQCMESLASISIPGSEGPSLAVVNAVRYLLFIGSLLSCFAVVAALLIFYYFKSLRCNRITIQINLMLALLFRSLVIVVITEPFVIQRETNYRTLSWSCKAAVALYMLTTAMSTNWMFIHGHFLHARVTTNVFDKGAPFLAYFAIGWGFPIVLIIVWACAMELDKHTYCWRDYGKSNYVWIIVGPLISALVANLLFLVNILRILLTKIHLATLSSDWIQFRRAVKATMVLGPILGVNNLLFCYNPGGIYEPVYMITNALFQATQGFVVTVIYCFSNKEVLEAVQREYCRYKSRRYDVNGLNLFTLKKGKSIVRHCGGHPC